MHGKPRSDADAPSIDRGALSRMYRLDQSLVVTWNRHAIDALTGKTIIADYNVDTTTGAVFRGGAVVDPTYHLWRRDDVNRNVYHYVMPYAQFSQKEVGKLERDVARFIEPKHIMAERAKQMDERRKREKDAASQLTRDKVLANAGKVMDVMRGKRDTRDGKIFSGGGIGRRGSTGRVRPDSHEAGWELPTRQQGR